MRFRFYSLHKRLQIDAFSKETLSVLVWTESLNATKCMRGHLFGPDIAILLFYKNNNIVISGLAEQCSKCGGLPTIF